MTNFDKKKAANWARPRHYGVNHPIQEYTEEQLQELEIELRKALWMLPEEVNRDGFLRRYTEGRDW